MNKRTFLKAMGLLGMTLTGGKSAFAHFNDKYNIRKNAHTVSSGNQHFNMCGFAAEKLEVLRIGYIGLGNRGGVALSRVVRFEGVDVKAICDIRIEKINKAKKQFENTPHNPHAYCGNEDEWRKLCERADIDLVYICTPWHLHVPMALYAMEQGKHVAVEVPAATSVEDCWKLVETSERTRKHCTMLENCCYGFFELLTLNMARQGYFGEIIHGEGAYIHDILEGHLSKTKNQNKWRLRANFNKNGNLYPTHGLGPICQIMNINRGDKMEYLTSMSSNDFSMMNRINQLASQDDEYKEFVGIPYRGNMNTSIIRTYKGRTIMLQHDVSSPRPYSRIHLVSGTKNTAQEYPLPGRISNNHEWVSESEFEVLNEKYKPNILKRIEELAIDLGDHGGMSLLMDWRLFDCLRNGLPLDQDVYDAALWSSVGALSVESVSNRSNSVDVPDFTRGAWRVNSPVDINMDKGGTTRVK